MFCKPLGAEQYVWGAWLSINENVTGLGKINGLTHSGGQGKRILYQH
jgi:hypothetical protein